ncbi:hypothetical protein IT568_02985 [bacterium]|nr:hypothetical protein [bacterium]
MKVRISFYNYTGKNKLADYRNAEQIRKPEEANSSTEFFNTKSVRDFDTIDEDKNLGEYLMKIGEEVWLFKWK